MLTEERHQLIRERLSRHGRVIAADLARELAVSEDTVRRDLRELARAGECRKVYGGALAPAPDLGSLAERQGAFVENKLKLAAAAATLVGPNQTVFLDAGSTNLAVAAALPRDLPLTMITNAPAIALALSGHDRVRTLLLGGRFDPVKGACLGAAIMREIGRIHADLLILGTCGVDARVGVTAIDPEEAELKRAMVEQSGRLVVPVTNDKLGTLAPYLVAEPQAIDHLVVEADADPATLADLASLGAAIHFAA